MNPDADALGAGWTLAGFVRSAREEFLIAAVHHFLPDSIGGRHAAL